jgi:hypothetical protein
MRPPHSAVCYSQVFAELYGTNELLSSFDSINLMAPGTDATGGWLHVDHAPLKKGCQCIQGLINMVDVGPDTTGMLICTMLYAVMLLSPVSALAVQRARFLLLLFANSRCTGWLTACGPCTTEEGMPVHPRSHQHG